MLRRACDRHPFRLGYLVWGELADRGCSAYGPCEDEGVAHAWAALRLALRDAGKKMPVNDSWIAATAIANDLPVASRDGDHDDVPGLRVLRV